MDLDNQQHILDAATKYRAEDILVIIGTTESIGVRNFSETVTAGDQSYTGSLAGVPLGLPVYHILDPLLRRFCRPVVWRRQIARVGASVNAAMLVRTVTGMRKRYGRCTLEPEPGE